MQQSKRGGGGGWIGWLIFFFLVFGSNFLPPVAQWLTNLTGVSITPTAIIVAVIALSVVSSLVGSSLRAVVRTRSGNETRLPLPPSTPLPTSRSKPPVSQPAPPPTSVKLPPSSSGMPPPRIPSGEQRLPSPPRFEPIIDPRVLTFGILGLLGIGGFLFLVLAMGTP